MKTTNYLAAAVAVAIVMILCGGLLLTAVPAPVSAAPVAQAAPPRTVTLYGPPAVGEFVRVKVVATGAVTPTVKATYR